MRTTHISETLVRSHVENLNLIKQQVRLISAMLEIEDDDHIALAIANQKSAFEWVLELFGAEPADASVIPPLNEPEYDYTEFRRYCEANNIPLGRADVEFVEWLYSTDNSMNRPVAERDSASFVLDDVLDESKGW